MAEVTRILRFLELEPDPGRLECVRWCDVDMYRYRCTVQYSTGGHVQVSAEASTEFGGSFHNMPFKHEINGFLSERRFQQGEDTTSKYCEKHCDISLT